MIAVYDGNNYYRKVLETDHTGMAPRGILNELMMMDKTSLVIWCWDGSSANSRRREVYDPYKRNRKPIDKDIYAGFDFLKQVLKHTQAIQIEVPGYEADDVIATLVRRYAGVGHQIAVYSNDFDLQQLSAEFPNRVFTGSKPKASVPAKYIRHYKVLVGDPSDNIPGIKGFGEKAWEALGPEMAGELISDIINGNEFTEMRLSQSTINWLHEPDNQELLRKFWFLVNFIEVPQELLESHTMVGDRDYVAADNLLKEFML